MPSTLIGVPAGSGIAGPQLVYSGNLWSGQGKIPTGSLFLKLSPTSSGNIYIGFSGNMTMNSGHVFLSGGGTADGIVLAPGDTFTVPKLVLRSGQLNVYAHHDAACSGQARLYWQPF